MPGCGGGRGRREKMAENASRETQRVDRLLTSALESADEAEHLVLAAAQELGFPEEEQHKIGVAVRESIVNAVVHGNRYNARKKVHLSVAGAKDHLEVTVGDEGDGFDLESLPDPLEEGNLLQQSGRGIFLIRAFMDEFEVRRRAAGGTEVKLIKYLRNKH
jgi:serine/threonine-protein kinase RsbW